MTEFSIMATLTCPSNWTEEDCRSYMERILASKREKDSLVVIQLDSETSTLLSELQKKCGNSQATER